GNISLGALLSTFIVGSLTIAFTNGGIGAYPYFVAQILVLFGYQETAGIAFGWLLWGSQTLLTIVYGLSSYLYIALRFTKK
ncbi:MAG: UPF0104 family protein, partial [Flavobacteriaceae bacterium]|nr:UPF0104 family protein [Flavobacteriaceae bacterium]